MSNLSQHVPSYVAKLRLWKDRAATVSITAGGSGVLIAILLIFFYLLYEVLPLFGNASITAREPLPGVLANPPLYLAMEEQAEVGFVVDAVGDAIFFNVASGQEILRETLHVEPPAIVRGESAASRQLAVAYPDGTLYLYSHEYQLSYPDGERVITPRLERKWESIDFRLPEGMPTDLAFRDGEEALTLATITDVGAIVVQVFDKEEDFLSGEVSLQRRELDLPLISDAKRLFVGAQQRWLYVLNHRGEYSVVDLQRAADSGAQELVDTGTLFAGDANLSASDLLLGGYSLLAASNEGEVTQHFMVRDPQGGHYLQHIRSFDSEGIALAQLLPEHRRKGFIAVGHAGEMQIYHTTAHRRLLSEQALPEVPGLTALSPRGSAAIHMATDGTLRFWKIDNKHPDISWSALWSEVWYEGYDQPEYTWQSSASNNDFEPKYSFAPLAFGTLKAAFYTMLIAAPMAICGAIYTAYFMAPGLRRKIKPMIELMEALPTVILGFLAGLWLAPLVEDNLTAVVTVLLILPMGVLVAAFAWSKLPMALRAGVPEGWHAALLLPVVAFLFWLSFALNDSMEFWLFGGDMRLWLTQELGVSFDQRNSLIVGIAMGMAVIPTIFSISEDAIFSVPKHLSYGSLALGATPWQTLVGVVLPTASPGIFSGSMIGLGRAVGETMIVLMATGNTPIMDANIFEGMRTLSANIAVEIPEAEVDSTHYRVLFLAAFVLFLFTFAVNTTAELVRQRLREKYGSL